MPTRHKNTALAAALVALLATPLTLPAQDRYSIPADPKLKYSTPIAPGVAVPDKIESSIGTLDLSYGYPSAETVEKIYDNLDRSRALQAYLMAIPIVNQAGMRDSIGQYGPVNQTDVIWENLVDPRTVELTANDNTIYNFMWIDTKKGPLVAEIPPGVLGLVNDFWYRWVGDVGITGEGTWGQCAYSFILYGWRFSGLCMAVEVGVCVELIEFVICPRSGIACRGARLCTLTPIPDLNGGKPPVGLYPIPPNLPVETWPTGTGLLTLEEWQQDKANTGGDRHAIIVQPGTGKFWETWEMKRVGESWQASNGAQFSLDSNGTRPKGWTSGDAAGLPMFPALVRYDECQRGEIRHAMRLVVKRTRVGPIYPATHSASVGNTTDPDIPAMGQRLRLKADFAIPPDWTSQEKAVLTALKKFGAIVADNGGFFSISITPDDRYPEGCFDHLSAVGIENFEVIQTTGPR